MEFFIKKNATLPLLLLRLILDGRSDYKNFFDSLTATTISFSMIDINTKIPKVLNKVCEIKESPNSDEYFLYYHFTNKNTNKVGRYEGEFKITYDQGVIGLPLAEKIFINVVDSFVADNLSYSNSSFIIDNPCCG